ncbi:hypothetical protein OAM67_00010 [bacterium]|nr:hypothetical protein [bacterium]
MSAALPNQKKTRRRRRQNLNRPIFQTMKAESQTASISRSGMAVMNGLVEDCLARILCEAEKLRAMSGSHTLRTHDVKQACLLVFGQAKPETLSSVVQEDMDQALQHYKNSLDQ